MDEGLNPAWVALLAWKEDSRGDLPLLVEPTKPAVLVRAVPAFELAISQAIFHSKDLSEKNLT
jgi:hypothetical protein